MQQSNRLPYGNAFLVSTPAIDRVGERMINDAKQQQLNEARQGQALDAEYGKNVSLIRDADIPDLTKKWGEYKALKMDLYKNGNKLNNDTRIQKELEAQRKLGEAYQTINNSKVEKAGEDDYYKRYKNNPDKFEDIAPAFLSKRRNLSVSQLQNTPFADIAGNVELQNTDFSKPIVNAMGKETVRKTINNVSTDGLTTTPTEVKAFNSPRQYAAQLENEVFSNRKNKHLLNQFNYDGNKANDIVQRFNKLRETPEFKSAYGDEMNYTPEEFADPTKRTIALMSMEHALLYPPTLIEGKPYKNYTQGILNEGRRYKEGEFNRRNKITFAQSMTKIAANSAKGLPPQQSTPYISDFVASSNGTKVTENGVEKLVVYPENVDQGRLNTILGVDINKGVFGVEGTPIKQPNGTTRLGYYVNPETGDWTGAENKLAASREAAADRYVNTFSGSKFKAAINTQGKENTKNNNASAQSNNKPKKKITW